ncbi:MAG: (2Fe-2S)-binding protein [Planctomycetes bacterium]|jgi:NAD(P)H-nitrite reductase large subunit|nr:(2Fe-2S)-binding protein [Planctomycetota bacterium]
MLPDDHVCLCFRVSLRKLTTYLECERPRVASELSQCHGAGTGCHWCVPFLEKLHAQWIDGKPIDVDMEPSEYAKRRADYRSQVK